jgi:four helix bundle protein
MAVIRGFRDLEVYQRSKREAKSVFLATKRFPRDERFSLTDQVRRSSRATGSMIAEAWARRRYPAAFISKLTEALGEAMETQAWLDHALECEYLTEEEHMSLDGAWQEIGAMLNGMIEKTDAFCPGGARR